MTVIKNFTLIFNIHVNNDYTSNNIELCMPVNAFLILVKKNIILIVTNALID